MIHMMRMHIASGKFHNLHLSGITKPKAEFQQDFFLLGGQRLNLLRSFFNIVIIVLTQKLIEERVLNFLSKYVAKIVGVTSPCQLRRSAKLCNYMILGVLT